MRVINDRLVNLHSKRSNILLLALLVADPDGRAASREVGCILSSQLAAPAIEKGKHTLSSLDPVAINLFSRASVKNLGAQHRHQAVKQAVNNLEPARLSTERSGKVPLVLGLALQGLVLESDIAGLKDLDGQTVLSVFSDGLEEAREQACAHNLVLGRLGVRQAHRCLAVVLAVEPGKVLVVRAQDQGHDLGPAAQRCLEADNVGELVEREGLCDEGAAALGEGPVQVVVAVSDGDVLHDVALV